MSTPNPSPSLPVLVDAQEVVAVKDALNADITDFGVGVLHLPAARVFLCPASRTSPVGHAALVSQLQLNRAECRGFVIAKHPGTGQFVVENISGLNVGSGGTGMSMPVVLFQAIEQALLAAGL